MPESRGSGRDGRCIERGMITVLVRATTGAEPLAVTFSALVPAVAEGIVSHAVAIAPADAARLAAIERIADAMGAQVVSDQANAYAQAALVARGEWVLLLEAGEVMITGWTRTAERHLARHPAGMPGNVSAGFWLRSGLAGWQERLAVMLAPTRLRPGLLAPRAAITGGTGWSKTLILPGGRTSGL